MTRAAARFRVEGIKQDRFRLIRSRALRLEAFVDAQGLDAETAWKRAAILDRLVAVQLHSCDLRLLSHALDRLRTLLVDEDTDAHHSLRKMLDDTTRFLWRDKARAAPVKIEPQRIRARQHSHERVLQIRDPANFDSYHIKGKDEGGRMKDEG
jgi:hypothetical protein